MPADPLLTPLGEDQAREACQTWKEEREAGIPIPDRVYCSPMTRALQTCRLTFNGVLDLAQKRPLILEVRLSLLIMSVHSVLMR